MLVFKTLIKSPCSTTAPLGVWHHFRKCSFNSTVWGVQGRCFQVNTEAFSFWGRNEFLFSSFCIKKSRVIPRVRNIVLKYEKEERVALFSWPDQTRTLDVLPLRGWVNTWLFDKFHLWSSEDLIVVLLHRAQLLLLRPLISVLTKKSYKSRNDFQRKTLLKWFQVDFWVSSPTRML